MAKVIVGGVKVLTAAGFARLLASGRVKQFINVAFVVKCAGPQDLVTMANAWADASGTLIEIGCTVTPIVQPQKGKR